MRPLHQSHTLAAAERRAASEAFAELGRRLNREINLTTKERGYDDCDFFFFFFGAWGQGPLSPHGAINV